MMATTPLSLPLLGSDGPRHRTPLGNRERLQEHIEPGVRTNPECT